MHITYTTNDIVNICTDHSIGRDQVEHILESQGPTHHIRYIVLTLSSTQSQIMDNANVGINKAVSRYYMPTSYIICPNIHTFSILVQLPFHNLLSILGCLVLNNLFHVTPDSKNRILIVADKPMNNNRQLSIFG